MFPTFLVAFPRPHLEGFDEGPKKSANALPSAEQLDEPHDSKETEERDGDAGAVLCVLGRKKKTYSKSQRQAEVQDAGNLGGMRSCELRSRNMWAGRTALHVEMEI